MLACCFLSPSAVALSQSRSAQARWSFPAPLEQLQPISARHGLSAGSFRFLSRRQVTCPTKASLDWVIFDAFYFIFLFLSCLSLTGGVIASGVAHAALIGDSMMIFIVVARHVHVKTMPTAPLSIILHFILAKCW